ncbi:MAG: Coenzyme F420 hydrogenase/dehydrogenase, beta subunit C-terminal domain [Bacilli bacterium]|nr:Coenzyme F420 hydrogenase/dehydrogenase, beta subunit C-terminal domain [Bacilli bacterium]MDD4808766.1 Coenzyme F420 hydrogenase/dehydrogenase, beta subunit C-terminal domain [Bacilli bacterium]
MRNIKNLKGCTGCTACESNCPTKCIKIKPNNEGFNYPIVDENKCTSCGLCIKVCPILNDLGNNNFEIPVTYAAWNKDESKRKTASSGGIFEEIAINIINQNGIVVGAGYDEHFNVVHKIINNIKDIEKLKTSKYVQSDLNDILVKIKKELKNKKVLFVGTPCQIAGLKSFIKNDYNNLYIVDFVCHGVPSPKVYKKYLEYLEKKYKSKITSISFRDKTDGWKNFGMKISFENKVEYLQSLKKDDFVQGFLKNIYLRDSCYDCKFSKLPRDSDITLGDFWRIENKHPELDDDKGTSLLLVNSDKGKWLLDECKDNLFIQECNIEDAIAGNSCIVSSVDYHPKRDQFFKDLDHMSFDKLSKKYITKGNVRKKIIFNIRRVLGKIKRTLKL